MLCAIALSAQLAADEKPAAAEKPASTKARNRRRRSGREMENIFNEFGFRLNPKATQPKIGEHEPGSGVRIEPEKVVITGVQARTWKSSNRKAFKFSKKYTVDTRDDLEKLLATSQFQKATIIDFHYAMDSGEPSSFSFVRRSEIERARKEEETRVILDIPFV